MYTTTLGLLSQKGVNNGLPPRVITAPPVPTNNIDYLALDYAVIKRQTRYRIAEAVEVNNVVLTAVGAANQAPVIAGTGFNSTLYPVLRGDVYVTQKRVAPTFSAVAYTTSMLPRNGRGLHPANTSVLINAYEGWLDGLVNSSLLPPGAVYTDYFVSGYVTTDDDYPGGVGQAGYEEYQLRRSYETGEVGYVGPLNYGEKIPVGVGWTFNVFYPGQFQGAPAIKLFKQTSPGVYALVGDAWRENVADAYISGVTAELYVVTDTEYYVSSRPMLEAGALYTADFSNETFNPNAFYVTKIRNGANALLGFSCEKTFLPSSYTFGVDDPAYALFLNRSYLYDCAVTLLALIALGKTANAHDLAAEILLTALPNGAFPMSVNAASYESDAYVRNGTVAWVLYALAVYCTEYAITSGAVYNGAVAAANYLVNDTRYGTGLQENAIMGGYGRYTLSVLDAPARSWTVTAPVGNTRLSSVVTDSLGNIYMSGMQDSSGGTGNGDASFVTKYGPNAELIWQRRLVRPSGEGVIFVDSAFNVFLGSSNNDSYSTVAMYNSDGTLQWVRQISESFNSIASISGNGTDAIYIGGGIGFNQTTDCVTVAKLDYTGNMVWSRVLTSNDSDRTDNNTSFLKALAVDAAGSVYGVGQHIKYAGGSYPEFTHVFKYNSAGVLQWKRQLTGLYYDRAGIAVTPAGVVTIASSMYNPEWISNPVVAQYSTSGVLQWKKEVLVTNFGVCNSVTLDASGNAYINAIDTTAGFENTLMVMKFTPAGACSWQRKVHISASTSECVGIGLATTLGVPVVYAGSFKRWTGVMNMTVMKQDGGIAGTTQDQVITVGSYVVQNSTAVEAELTTWTDAELVCTIGVSSASSYAGGLVTTVTDGGVEVFEPSYTIPWASTEHNIDAVFALLQMYELTSNPAYLTATNLIKANLYTTHWQGKYLYQGISNATTIDTTSALDCMTWGSYLFHQYGDTGRASDSMARAQRKYKTHSLGANGFTPYIAEDGYFSATPTVWPEGTYGAAIGYYRFGNYAKWNYYISQMNILRLPDGSLPYASVRDSVYELTDYPGIIGVAWDVLARVWPHRVFAV